ncbi:MAG: peptidoglycan-binding domain-containing protein, partial [Bacteroidia bacterium]|nr:peptidoglycan-binding domain-containing protein [Bacteroidia bacterium]
ALFVQNYFGDQNADPSDTYARLDHDYFNGNLLQLLSMTAPGYVIDNTFPRSTIVRDIQNALAAKQVSPGAADGYFGPNTEKAVKAFQTSRGLEVSGIVDVATWNKLL